MTDVLDTLATARDAQRKSCAEAREQRIRVRFLEIMRTKFRTCFIFPLSEFETTFGLELWGQGLPDEELTPQQRANKERWKQVRTNILNTGNTQLRALQAELGLHAVAFQGYRTELRGKT